MAIGRIGQPIPGASQRLEENQGRLPFKSVDTNNKGSISKEELTNAVRLNFPTLTDLEASAIGAKAFDAGSKNGKSVTSSGWKKAEAVVLREAEISINDKARLAEAPGAWGAGNRPATRPEQAPLPQNYEMPPPPVPSNMYQPRQDLEGTGQPPYQAPAMPAEQTRSFKAGAAVGRGLMGFLKMLPVVGNLINAYDFVKDIGKGVSTWLNPNKTFGEKLKAGADLLFHGAGMIVPQVGGAYDLAQSAVRLAGVAANVGQQPNQELPAWQMDQGGYPPRYPMEYANPPRPPPPPQNEYSQYPGYNAPAYDPYSPQQPQVRPETLASTGDAKESAQGLARMGIGALKMVPVLGNVLNGLDFLRDIGRVMKNIVTLQPAKVLKAGADLLFHGAGMVIPQVGGAYDLAQGMIRTAAAAPAVPAWAQSQYQPDPWASLPAFTPDERGYLQPTSAY